MKTLLQNNMNNKLGYTRNFYQPEFMSISAYLFLRLGLKQYDFLNKNALLPSVSTIRNHIMRDIRTMEEGVIRVDGLVDYLKTNDYSMEVSILEDATKIVECVEIDYNTDTLLGLSAPFDMVTGMPKKHLFVSNTLENISDAVKNFNKSSYVNIILAQPNNTNAIPYLLGYFGTDNRFKASVVLARMKFIKKCLAEKGIETLSFGSDGDSRHLLAQKILLNFGMPQNYGSLTLAGNINADILSNQDSLHLTKKLKSSLYQASHYLTLGKYKASIEHLHILFRKYSKELHNLNSCDLDIQDKMNYR